MTRFTLAFLLGTLCWTLGAVFAGRVNDWERDHRAVATWDGSRWVWYRTALECPRGAMCFTVAEDRKGGQP